MKRQPIFTKLMLQEVFNCHYMQPTQIHKELCLRSTCRHLFYYGGLRLAHFSDCVWYGKASLLGVDRINQRYIMLHET